MSTQGSWTEYEIRDKERPNVPGNPCGSRETADGIVAACERLGKAAFVHERHITHTESVVYVVVSRHHTQPEDHATRHSVTEWNKALSYAAACREIGKIVRIEKHVTETKSTVETVEVES